MPPLPHPNSPLSLHDALPILPLQHVQPHVARAPVEAAQIVLHSVIGLVRSPVERKDCPERAPGLLQRGARVQAKSDRKSTRLNSSHANISYAVFCLKKIIRFV